MTQARNDTVRLRLTTLEKQDWTQAAGGARKLSEWIRATCNAAAEQWRRENSPGMTDLMVTPESIDDAIPNAKPVIVGDAIERSIQEQAHRDSRPLPATEAPGAESSSGDRSGAPGGGATSGQCPRWMHHRPNTYCGACKRVIAK